MSSTMLQLDPQLASRVNELAKFPTVRKVVAGSFSRKKHNVSPGTMKFVAREPNGATVRIYTKKGMQNMHVYCEATALAKALAAPDVILAKPEAMPQAQPVVTTPAPVTAPVTAPSAKANGGIAFEVVMVSPELAAEWLVERNTNNRKVSERVTKSYASDMKTGRWKLGASVIKFDTNNVLINGQHVLWAIIEANIAVECAIMTGLAPDVAIVEDTGKRRSLKDAFHFAGSDRAPSTQHTACSSSLRLSLDWAKGRSVREGDLSYQDQMEFYNQHAEAIDFAVRSFTGKDRRNLLVGSVTAVIARAWYTEDNAKLVRFAKVLQSGIVDDVNENAAVLLRKSLQASETGQRTMLSRTQSYWLAERALRAFLDGERLQQLRPASSEMFPLPEENDLPRGKRPPMRGK